MQLIYFLSSSCYDVDSWNGKARHSVKRTKSADMGCRFVCMSLSHTEYCPTKIMNMLETECKHNPPVPDGWNFFSLLLLAKLSDVHKPAVSSKDWQQRWTDTVGSSSIQATFILKNPKQTTNQTEVLFNSHLRCTEVKAERGLVGGYIFPYWGW